MSNFRYGIIDSNIWIYSINPASDFHNEAIGFLREILTKRFAITPQIILEIYNVIVDPKKVVKPLSSKEAYKYLSSIGKNHQCDLLIPSKEVFDTCMDLAQKNNLQGQQKIYDCYLASMSLTNHIDTIYTINIKDFKIYPFLKAINPFI
mgnify:CR=1 FL=1